MIPQVGMTELLLIGALALIVVGPKDLPLLMRKLGKMVGQAKRLAREFTSSFEELGRQAELDELRREVEALKRDATGDLDKELRRTNQEIADATRIPPPSLNPSPAPAGAQQPNTIAAPVTHPAAPPKPAGPRIEQPAVQARPRPEAAAQAAEPAKTDAAP